VTQGPDAGKRFEHGSREPLSIGSAPDAGLALADKTVSRYHLELAATPDGVRVVDLGSLNGTFVGGLRVERAVVPAGAAIRAGATVFRVEDGDAVAVDEGAAASIPGMIGVSPGMRAVAREVERLAASTVSVLVQGETGTGKEVVASAIHERSARKGKPFVVVDCGSMPATLVASELFGHERGAFTGADRQRIGAFEQADGGTIFLDEIGELPLPVQPSLLGALERRRFRRVGGNKDIEVDVRVISATHRDLRAEVNADRFRADLYYRLAVARIVIPSLRDRPEDVDPLVRHFVTELTGETDLPFGDATMDALRAHRWSGNVRELRNVVEAAVAMGEVKLDATKKGIPGATAATIDDTLAPYKESRATALDTFERAYLTRLIAETQGNASEASRLARMDRQYLLSLLRKHRLR
jgi:DNA-binding NtrC family response regulator